MRKIPACRNARAHRAACVKMIMARRLRIITASGLTTRRAVPMAASRSAGELAMAKSRKRRTTGRRAKPGARGHGGFFHIQVRPKRDFVSFRNQDVGVRGGIERVAGRRANGTWDTQKWLVSKTQAHLDGKQLAPDTAAARKLLAQLGSPPRHLGGDRFIARPRRDISESEKPTPAMRRAQLANIKKAQTAVQKRRGTKARAKA